MARRKVTPDLRIHEAPTPARSGQKYLNLRGRAEKHLKAALVREGERIIADAKRMRPLSDLILSGHFDDDSFKAHQNDIERAMKEAQQRLTSSAVDHPHHYGGADDPFEHVKVARAKGWTSDAFLYNATKYLWRLGKKDEAIQEIKKAIWYLTEKVKDLEATRSEA